MRTPSLGQEIRFSQVLPLLGISIKSTVLPATTRCPCCQEDGLCIYRDFPEQQDWFYCRSCHRCGDMIELAATAWKLDIPAAAQKLHAGGILTARALVGETITEYLSRHVQFRRCVGKFWSEARNWSRDNQRMAVDILRRLRLPEIIGDWELHGGRYFGVASRETVAQAIFGAPRVEFSHLPRDFGAPRGTLIGPGWAHCLVLPYYALPGRICGVLLVGQNAAEETQSAYLRVESLNQAGTRCAEAGLAMMENAALPSHRLFGRTVFAITDPLLALRMQILHLQTNPNPLPIIATFEGPRAKTVNAWQSLNCERTICWSPQDSLAGIFQAKNAGGFVAELVPIAERISRVLSERGPLGLLKSVVRGAVAWDAGLRHHLADLNREDAEAALTRMELTNTQLAEFSLGCGTQLREQIEAVRDYVGAARQVRFNHKTVSEQDHTWTYGKGELLANAVLRINQVITSRRERTYYRGVIYFRDKEIPFLEQAKTLEKLGFEWLFTYVRDHANAGTISYCPSWRKHLVGLALIFHEPDQVQGAEVIGWDVDRQVVQFPSFAMRPDGVVDLTSQCLLTGPHLPANHLKPPEMFYPRRLVRKLWEDNDEARIVWATTIAVLANLLAPIANRERHGVLLDGEGATSMGEAAAILLGCPELIRSHENVVTLVQEKLHPHTWPAVLRPAAGKSLEPGRWLEAPEARHLIVSLPPIANQVLGLRQTWHIIRGARPLGSLQLTTEALPQLLPHYLQSWLSRRPDAPADIDGLTEDLAQWFQSQAGIGERVRAARQLLEVAGATDPARFFVRLIAYALNLGTLRAGREEEGAETELLYLADGKHVWVAQTPMSDTATRYGGLPLDVLLVTRLLEAAGSLRRESRRRGSLGWEIDREWWDHNWTALAK